MATQNAIDNRINGAAGAVVTSTTGALSVADGGTAGQVLTSTGTNSTPTFQALPTNKPVTMVIQENIPQVLFTTAALRYTPLSSSLISTAGSEGISNQVMPIAATIGNLTISVTTNANTADGIMTLRVNGASTALTATVTASSTGTFTNTTDKVSVNAGDLVCWQCTQATTGNTSVATFSFSVEI